MSSYFLSVKQMEKDSEDIDLQRQHEDDLEEDAADTEFFVHI